MNRYINYVNNFWCTNNIHQFTTSAIAVYFCILNQFNNNRWSNDIIILHTVRIANICYISTRTFTKALNELKSGGLLDFEQKNGSKYTHIRLLPVRCIFTQTSAQTYEKNVEVEEIKNKTSTQTSTQTYEKNVEVEEKKQPDTLYIPEYKYSGNNNKDIRYKDISNKDLRKSMRDELQKKCEFLLNNLK